MSTAIHARVSRVHELQDAGLAPREITAKLQSDGVVNPKTSKPYSEATVRLDMKSPRPQTKMIVSGAPTKETVSEMIGRISYLLPYYMLRKPFLTFDATRPDYMRYDQMRNGKLQGFELVGGYIMPIVETIAGFEFGTGITVSLVDGGDPTNERDDRNYTDQQLLKFVSEIQGTLVTIEEEKMALGDQFVFVNPDGTLTIPTPDTVMPETNELDYREVEAYTIETRMKRARVTDRYTRALRLVEVTRLDSMDTGTYTQTFPNLIDEIPCVHFANDKRENELFGRVIYFALLKLFQRMNTLLEKGIDGVELMGNPIPTLSGLRDVDNAISQNQTPYTPMYNDGHGNTVNRTEIAVDKQPFMFLPEGSEFNLVSPTRGFSEDLRNVIGELITLICNNTHIPEFMLIMKSVEGVASVQAQLPPFVQYIISRRLRLQEDLKHLVRIWLKIKALVDPRIVVDEVRVTFPEITLEDAQITLQKVIYADGKGRLTDETALEKLHIVPDPVKEVQQARKQLQERMLEQAAQDDYMTRLNASANQQMDVQRDVGVEQPKITSLTPPDPDGGRNVRMDDGSVVGELIAELTNDENNDTIEGLIE